MSRSNTLRELVEPEPIVMLSFFPRGERSNFEHLSATVSLTSLFHEVGPTSKERNQCLVRIGLNGKCHTLSDAMKLFWSNCGMKAVAESKFGWADYFCEGWTDNEEDEGEGGKDDSPIVVSTLPIVRCPQLMNPGSVPIMFSKGLPKRTKEETQRGRRHF